MNYKKFLNVVGVVAVAVVVIGCGGSSTGGRGDKTEDVKQSAMDNSDETDTDNREAMGIGYSEETDTENTFTDSRDGKTYKKVVIGTQTWMAENLNYAAEGSVCYNNSPDSCAKYGHLYKWETALTACPAGTHLPNNKEWNMLVNYVGGWKTGGTKLKSSTGWKSESGIPAGTNDYGFSALPGGGVDLSGEFGNVGEVGRWWSSKDYSTVMAYFFHMWNYNENVLDDSNNKEYSFSIRCVVD
jgi:uncharacterized protein (TIGR02145 family)